MARAMLPLTLVAPANAHYVTVSRPNARPYDIPLAYLLRCHNGLRLRVQRRGTRIENDAWVRALGRHERKEAGSARTATVFALAPPHPCLWSAGFLVLFPPGASLHCWDPLDECGLAAA